METHEYQYYNLTKNVFDNLQICAITYRSIQSKIEILLEMALFAIDYRLHSTANSLCAGTQLFLYRVGHKFENKLIKVNYLFSIVV